jgi:hypothetical protein
MRLQSCLLVPFVAHALVGPHHVLADAVRTDAAGPGAFVDVLAGLFVGGEFVSWGALALVRSVRVEAVTSSAQSGYFVAFVYVHANLHRCHGSEPFVALAHKISRDVLADSIPANVTRRDATLVDVYTFDSVVVIVITFVAPATIPPYGVLAASVLTHPRKFGALVDVFPIDEAWTFGAQLQVRLGPWSGTRFAFFSPPPTNSRTTTKILVEEAVDGTGTLAVFVAHVALFLSYVQTERSCFIKGKSRGTSAGEAPVGVDASASSANVGVQIALVDVRASFAVDFGVAFGTVALVAVASYARGTPRDSYRTTTLRASAQLRQVVLAASVVEFGPTRTFAIVYADSSGVVQNRSRVALAFVRTKSVDALSVEASLGAQLSALVNVLAHESVRI